MNISHMNNKELFKPSHKKRILKCLAYCSNSLWKNVYGRKKIRCYFISKWKKIPVEFLSSLFPNYEFWIVKVSLFIKFCSDLKIISTFLAALNCVIFNNLKCKVLYLYYENTLFLNWNVFEDSINADAVIQKYQTDSKCNNSACNKQLFY